MLSTGGSFERAVRSAQTGATHRVNAPPGNLGLAFATKLAANKGVMVEGVSKESPLTGLVLPGWLLLKVGEVSIAAGDYESVERLLQRTESGTRLLTFLDGQAESSLTTVVYEALSSSWSGHAYVTIEAPAGKLGLSVAIFNGKPVVQSLSADSPLRGGVGLRWELLQIDEVSVSKMGHAEIAKLLTDRAKQEKRTLNFKAEEPKKPPSMFLAAALVAVIAYCVSLVWANRWVPEPNIATPGFVEEEMKKAIWFH